MIIIFQNPLILKWSARKLVDELFKTYEGFDELYYDIKYIIYLSSSHNEEVIDSDEEFGFNDDNTNCVTNTFQYIDSYITKSHGRVQIEKSKRDNSETDTN